MNEKVIEGEKEKEILRVEIVQLKGTLWHYLESNSQLKQ